MSEALNLLKTTLQAHGKSVTAARLTVFKTLQDTESQTMHELVVACRGEIDRASIYRVIDLFERLGIVQRLQIGWKYKLELTDTFSHHHHHVTCKRCGQTTALPEDEQLENRLYQITQNLNFLPETHQIEVIGYCANCRTQKIA